jgi:hypothetical protein
MTTWNEFDELLTALTTEDYSSDRHDRKRKARDAIRKTFLAMEGRERENATLRQMLVDQGIENAQLTVELAQERLRADAWHSAAAAIPQTPAPSEPDADDHTT